VDDPPLFAIGGETVTLGAVLEAAEARGDLSAPRSRFLAARALERARDARGNPPDPEAVEAVADDLRYELGLITAEETEAWLSAHALTVEDLDAHCRTTLCAEALGDEAAGADEPVPPDEERRFRGHLVLSGVVAKEARALARRMAVLEDLTASDRPRDAAARSPARPLRERLAALESAYEARRATALSEKARARTLHAMRLALTRVDVEVLALPNVDAAREAVLCVREDGLPLPTLAAQIHRPYERRSPFLGDEDGELCDVLLSTTIGGMFLWAQDDEVSVWRVVAKREPDPADPEVARRIDEAVLDAYDDERVNRHVRWLVADPRAT
jgi:hypothetical protein